MVHAGIELLKDHILMLPAVEKSLIDLLDDVYTSSLGAINILSDLLNFENLDAGDAFYFSYCSHPLFYLLMADRNI